MKLRVMCTGTGSTWGKRWRSSRSSKFANSPTKKGRSVGEIHVPTMACATRIWATMPCTISAVGISAPKVLGRTVRR